MTLDETDRRILESLSADGRLSFEQLAGRVGLTSTACMRRVRKLEREGVIKGYAARVDPAAVGRGQTIFAGVRLLRLTAGACTEFERAVARHSEIAECHHVTGDYSFLLRIQLPDMAAYRAFYTEVLASLPGVGSVTTYVVMASQE